MNTLAVPKLALPEGRIIVTNKDQYAKNDLIWYLDQDVGKDEGDPRIDL